MEIGMTRNQIMDVLAKSPHGKLSEYREPVIAAATHDPEFMAHLIAWDRKHGQVRDSKVALPVLTLCVPSYHEEFVENSLAHLSALGPRQMLQALRFAYEVRPSGKLTTIKRVMAAKLKRMEPGPMWDRVALQHRATLKELYALLRIVPSERAAAVLWQTTVAKNKADRRPVPYPAGSIFETVAQLKNLSGLEAAGVILTEKIPFLVGAHRPHVAHRVGDQRQDASAARHQDKSDAPRRLLRGARQGQHRAGKCAQDDSRGRGYG
jgi:hypothetical protein